MSDGSRTVRGQKAYLQSLRLLQVFEAAPSSTSMQAWLLARAEFNEHSGNPDCQGRADRLKQLAADDEYLALATAAQLAIKAMADRRIFIIGMGTT